MNSRPWLAHYDPGVPPTSTTPPCPSSTSWTRPPGAARSVPARSSRAKRSPTARSPNRPTGSPPPCASRRPQRRARRPVHAQLPGVRAGLLRHPESRRGRRGDQPALHAARDRPSGQRCRPAHAHLRRRSLRTADACPTRHRHPPGDRDRGCNSPIRRPAFHFAPCPNQPPPKLLHQQRIYLLWFLWRIWCL